MTDDLLSGTEDPHEGPCGCPSPSRRTFLGGVAGATAIAVAGGRGLLFGGPAGAASSLFGSGTEGGTAPPGRLVVVFLRGGMDGLSAVAPVADGTYHSLRPSIGIPEAKALTLTPTFGMHPALAPLKPMYDGNRLAFVHAAGNPAGSRSHFSAQSLMEQGDDTNAADGLGWISRYLATKPGPDGAVARAAALSVNLTGSLRGSDALVVPSIDDYGLLGYAKYGKAALAAMYTGTRTIQVRGAEALSSVDKVSALDGTPVTGGAAPTAAVLGDVVALLGGNLGLEVVTVDIGGWDTHDAMGTVDNGAMRTLLADLGANLAGFQSALDAAGLTDVTTVVMSEFGRRLQQNGSGGLDHGFGNLMTVMGGGVAGGKVLTDWPGLTVTDQGDLRVTTDFRDVLWELVQRRLGHPNPGAVFPGHTHTPLPLLT